MTKTITPNKHNGGRPPSYDPNLVHTVILEGLAEGIPAAELDAVYVKEKLIKEMGVKSTVRPETLKGHVAAAHIEIVEAENKKLLAALPESIATAVDGAVAAAGKDLMLVVARQHRNSQAMAEKVCDELRTDKRNAQYRISDLEGELAQEKEGRKTLENERNALAEKLATAREELRIARSDLKRLSEQPSDIYGLLQELRDPLVRENIRGILFDVAQHRAQQEVELPPAQNATPSTDTP